MGILQEGDRILLKLRKLFETFFAFICRELAIKKEGGKLSFYRLEGKKRFENEARD